MNLQVVLAGICLAFGAYIWKGEPEKAAWPLAFGNWMVTFIKFCVANKPYVIILSIVAAVTALMTTKKY